MLSNQANNKKRSQETIFYFRQRFYKTQIIFKEKDADVLINWHFEGQGGTVLIRDFN